jgi:hypothetical protein
MQGRISWATIGALLLAAIFVAATVQTIDFPLGTLGDEWAKIDAVRTGNNRYYHPLLMIEMTQFANLFAGARDLQAIVEVGRACAALAGGLLVFATYWLGRLVLPELGALAAAAATAATPIVTVHARIMKEDIFVAPFLILGLAALSSFCKTQRRCARSSSAPMPGSPPEQNISARCSCRSRSARSCSFQARAPNGASVACSPSPALPSSSSC